MIDFFAQQDRARHTTRLLIIGFVVAVVMLLAGANLLVWLVVHNAQGVGYDNHGHHVVQITPRMEWQAYAGVTLFSLVAIVGGSMYKSFELRGGGAVVAAMMGGQLVSGQPATARERTLLNVVEEMAIASGVAVPPVFVMREETGINAFAAGHDSGDATITVTQGCLELLDREQLQGVIGHEFSHILNGDMRTNLRLIGILHGILLIGLAGRVLLRVVGNGRSSRDSKDGGGTMAMLVLALGLCAFGYLGFFLGGLIKAAVSRQREYLADASSVQFTRNPNGIAGALKRIGGAYSGAKLRHHDVQQISHMFLADAVGFWTPWMATHPPIEKRIRAVDPDWDGTFPEVGPEPDTEPRQQPEHASAFAGGAMAAAMAPVAAAPARMRVDAGGVAGRVATVSPDHVAYGATLLGNLPPALTAAAREPFAARAVIFALVLDPDPAKAGEQLAILARAGEPALPIEIAKLRNAVGAVDERARLPLIDLCVPALRQLSAGQQRDFATNLRALIAADNVVSLSEYCLYQLLSQRLTPTPMPAARYFALGPVQDDLVVLLSALAHAGSQTPAAAATAFAAAASRLTDTNRPLTLLRPESCGFNELDRALANLNLVNPGVKRRVITACAWCVSADGIVTVREAELLRVVSGALGCPLPPFMETA